MEHSSTISNSPFLQFTQSVGHRVCYITGNNESSSSKLRENPRVILLHGQISSHRLYRECWAGLDEMSHLCGADLIGFGDSDKPPRAGLEIKAQSPQTAKDPHVAMLADVEFLFFGRYRYAFSGVPLMD